MFYRATTHRLPVSTAVLLCVAVMFASGCSNIHPVVAPPLAAPAGPPVSIAPSDNLTIYVVAPLSQAGRADDNGLIPETVKSDPSSKDFALEAMQDLAASKATPLPQGTSILGVDLNQSTGLATVDFSHEFKDRFLGGDSREAQVISSVLETLGQFSTIQTVQFLVAGAKIDSLGGMQDLNTPLPIVRNTKEASAGS